MLLAARRLRDGDALARRVGWCIGGAYVLFGLGATASRWPNPHFLLFVALGGLLLTGTALASRAP